MPQRITLMRLSKKTGVPIGDLLERIHEIAGIPFTQADHISTREDSIIVPNNPTQKPAWAEGKLEAIVDLLRAMRSWMLTRCRRSTGPCIAWPQGKSSL